MNEAKIERAARMAHETNRAWCELIGDPSQKPWDEAEEWQRESAIKGVRAMLSGAAKTPEEQHEAWMRDKVAAGWIYGPEKLPNASPPTHPCLVSYAELPPEQRTKDTLFRAVVGAVIAE